MNRYLLSIPDRIETERVYLRPYRKGDGPMYFAAGERNRDHLMEYESGNVVMHLEGAEHAEATVRELAAYWVSRTCFFMGIFLKDTDRWAGQVYVGPTDWDLPSFVIGFVADVEHEGKGLISEAVSGVLKMLFVEMGAHRVHSDCNEHNLRSRRLLERCGFVREGHLRENRRSADGSVHGDFLFSMLQSEYRALHP